MAWLYKHPKSGRWFIGWRVNKRITCRSTGTSNKREAQKKLATLELMEQAKSAGRLTESFYRSLTAQETIKMPLLTAIGTFLEQAPAGGTRAAYASKLRGLANYLKANEGSPDVADVTRAAVQMFLNEHALRTSVSTANHYRKVLTVFFNFCAAEYRTDTPMEGIKKMKASTNELRGRIGTGRRPFTKEEMQAAYAVAGPFWRFAMMTAFFTGFRLGMIATLRWGNVNFDTWTFTIIDNKHAAEGGRKVPIVSPALRALLRSLRDAAPNATADEAIFPHYATKYLSNPQKPDGDAAPLSLEFRNSVMVPAGLAKPYETQHGRGLNVRRPVSELSFHSIKHNTVTTLKASGASEMAAREVVGHDSQAVSDLYTHTTQEHMADALRLLPEVFTT